MDIKDGIKQLDIEIKAKLLTGSSFWRTTACPDIGLDDMLLSDGPHGMRVQDKSPNHLGMGTSRPATCFPTASAMACSWDEELCFELAKRIGEEAAAEGVSVVLGPGMNIKRSPLCGRNFEYFSEDGYLSGKLAAAYCRGIQSNNVTSCIKHFAVNGRELARMYYDAAVDEQTLREIYLLPFEICVKEGRALAVMSAYNKLNGEYCNQNEPLLRGILRGEWGFDGLIVSDWGGSHDRVKAVIAGADLEMPRCDFSAREIIDAVRSGELDERLVDECVLHLHELCVRSQKIARVGFDKDEHSAFAERCAAESLVLLKNEKSALPLSKGEKIALIGDFAATPRYQGAGSSQVNPTSLKTLLAEMEKSDLQLVGFSRGFERFGKKNSKLEKQALKLAGTADTVVLCMGLDENSETEGTDRLNISLGQNQIALLEKLRALGKKIAVVLFSGSVVDLGWEENCDALLLAHLGGQSGAGAVLKALTGEVNPSGRLAESYIYNLGDAPCAADYASGIYNYDLTEGIYVGYKYYTTFGVPVRYPFGYGLSYTQFSYSGFSADENGVNITVCNTGGRAGATVVQAYVKLNRPNLKDNPWELKGFKKVFLNAGESLRVFIPFDRYAFRFRNLKNHAWEAGGDITVAVADNGRDMLFTQKITLTKLPEGCVDADMNDVPLGYDEYCAGHVTPRICRDEKGRVIADYYTPVSELGRCKGLVGKIFGWIAHRYLSSDDKLLSSSMSYLPLRSLMQFMNLSERQAEGFVEACNGKFFKGVGKLLFKGKKKCK